MNGFTSGMLTLLLSWIRSFVNDLWLALSSEGGSSFLSFLQEHWKTVFVGLCLGGFVVDRIVYLIRWRPYYVWSTKWGRLKRRLKGEDLYEEKPYLPLPVSYGASVDAPIPARLVPQEHGLEDTRSYAPLEPLEPESATISYPSLGSEAQMPIEPVFDDTSVAWTSPAEEQTRVMGSSLYAPGPILPMDAYHEPFEALSEDLPPAFGSSKPEPEQYLRDVQSGFAPPPTPEELYPADGPGDPSAPVHPGLDSETFQQNMGLRCAQDKPTASATEEPYLKPATDFPNTSFMPYYRSPEQESAPRGKSAFSSIAKKARSLVSIHDEDNPLSIRDLQPTVDIKDAFHAPVFPHKDDESGEE